MKVLIAAMSRARMVLTIALLLSLTGLLAWHGMDRQEDPSLPHRHGIIMVSWPGADPERVERLVLNVLEEELLQVDELHEIFATARLGFAQLAVSMQQHVYDTDAVWEQVREAARRAARRLPDGVGPIEIDTRVMETHGIVLAITGADDPLVLLEAARQLRRDLFLLPEMGRIEILADPGEQLTIAVDHARLGALGLSSQRLAQQIDAANQVLPGGALQVGERNLLLRAHSDFSTLEELYALPIRSAEGVLLPLGEFADIHLGPTEPVLERLWHNGQPAVALGIVIPENRLNAVRFGQQLRAHIGNLKADYAPLRIEEMFFQPDRVQSRLAELGRTLLFGALIVAASLLLMMGWRLGLLVTSLLPLVTLSGLAIYAIGGGVLHQIAVAGLVVALGMLVDNAIVMVENVQWHLNRGKRAIEAASASVRELAAPLAAATGTTLAAFTPLLLSAGDTADFTRAIPVMVMLILLISYLYAILVTPIMAARLLRPHRQSGDRMAWLGSWLGRVAIQAPKRLLLGAAALLLLTLAMSGWMQHDFFPSTDRNQLIIDLHFAEGTRIEHTTLQAGAIVGQLGKLPGVQQVHHFAGFSGPRFYYNLLGIPRAPHLARIVVISDSADDLPGLMHWARQHLPEQVPEAQLVVHRLGQGPPIEAPVAIRVYAKEHHALRQASEAVIALLRATPGTEDVRHRLGDGIPTLMFTIDDSEVARHGVSRRQIAAALAQATQGQTISTWRAGSEPLPIVMRVPEGEQLPTHALEGLMVDGPHGALPLSLFATPRLTMQAAVIEHHNLQRISTILAETGDGITHAQVLTQLRPALGALELPAGTHIAIAGAAAEDSSANSAVLRTMPVGVLLLLVFLLWQFNSWRRVGIVLLTIPLAAIGVVPGLILAGQPFGFTALLGVITLIGIVVNNAIVLLDVIERRRAEGETVSEAIIHAVSRRTRPILLTTVTTVVGLLPLTATQSTLWPPMAWAIISGLISATALTLLVIPAVYRLAFREGMAR